MKRFYVTERVPCVQVWTYEVEAETEEDAIKQVIAGTAEVVESIVEEYDYDESEYKVEEDEDDDILNQLQYCLSDDIVELERGENNK